MESLPALLLASVFDSVLCYQALSRDCSYSMYVHVVCNYAVLGKDTCISLSQCVCPEQVEEVTFG